MKRECCGEQTPLLLLLHLHRAQRKRAVTFKRRVRSPAWGFGEKCSAYFFWRKHQTHKSKTQNSSYSLIYSKKSESVTWLTVPLCPIVATLQRVWPAGHAHCAHADCTWDYLHVWAGPPVWCHSECWLMSVSNSTYFLHLLSMESSSKQTVELLECARQTEVVWKAALGLLMDTWKTHSHRAVI